MAQSEYESSIVQAQGVRYALVNVDGRKLLNVRGDAGPGETGAALSGLEFVNDEGAFYALNAENAAALRERLPWLKAQALGLKTSFGYGDRLGLATPGHIAAARESSLAPLFAQQSVRENARTGRTPRQVMDEAMWGVFESGWRAPWGADADHLKSTHDLPPFIAAGYTFFTVDPGEYVDNAAPTDTLPVLEEKVAALPWDVLEDSLDGVRARYVNKAFALDELVFTFREETLLRALVKYGRAVAHAVTLFRAIRSHKGGAEFDFEVSVDETELPTDAAEHFYIANELARLNVRVVSLAPRFIGRFEKGVDYIGDLAALQENLDQHAIIARHFNYKLSLHSGSDKLSVYPLFAASTRGLAHVKTAGTSYLEALRTIARVNPDLFREILTLARESYGTDRATYHVSAEISRVRSSAELSDAELPGLLDEFDAREVLHVTFGTALHRYRGEIYGTLRAHEAVYAETLCIHFEKHLRAFRS